MKRLILMRHAKSSWDDPLLDDHARVLNGRGRASADALGNWFRKKKYLPDQALVSDAARTRETFARLGIICETKFEGALYLAPAQRMMQVLKGASGKTVLMIGHNPGIAEFAEQIVGLTPDHTRFYDYPTGATLVVEFDIDDWSALRVNTGKVLDFVIPRELTG